MIRVLICDGKGTLQLPNPSNEIRNLVGMLPNLGIELAVASNENSSQNIRKLFAQAKLPIPKHIITPSIVGRKKPSPLFVEMICQLTGASKNEVIYLGDDDRTDIFCAINSKVLPLAAHYSSSGKPMQYGLPVNDLAALKSYLSTYAEQTPPYFGWFFVSSCQDTGKKIDIRALFGDHGDLGLTQPLIDLLKNGRDKSIGSKSSTSLGQLLFHYLVSQIYLSGLIQDIKYITVYPGHLANSSNNILSQYSDILKQTFNTSYLPDLLIRHTDAPESRRTPGPNRDIFEQFRTIQVNPSYKSKIKDASILVLDDFTTSGNSLETARRMLLNAQASNVVGLAVAKYRVKYKVTQINNSWDPFSPCTLSPADILFEEFSGNLNKQADQHFQNRILPEYSK